MNKYKFTVIGDSFALPRMNNKNGKYEIEIGGEEIYTAQLRYFLDLKFSNISFSFSNLSVQGNTTYNVLNFQCKHLWLYLEQPEFLILQIGLVDCWNRKGIETAPFEHMVGKDPWVDKDEYKKNIEEIISHTFEVCNLIKGIFIVNIPFVKEEQYKKHLNSYERSIEYNMILEEIAKKNKNIYLIDIFSYFESINKNEFETLFCHDNVHYNTKGNGIVAELICKKAESVISYFEAERLYRDNNIEEALEYIKVIDKSELTEEYQKKMERLERICLKKMGKMK